MPEAARPAAERRVGDAHKSLTYFMLVTHPTPAIPDRRPPPLQEPTQQTETDRWKSAVALGAEQRLGNRKIAHLHMYAC